MHRNTLEIAIEDGNLLRKFFIYFKQIIKKELQIIQQQKFLHQISEWKIGKDFNCNIIAFETPSLLLQMLKVH